MNKYLLISVMAILPSLAIAHEDHSNSVQNDLQDCIVQAAIGGKNMTGAFFDLKHEGSEQAIISAEIPALSNRVELHKMTMENNVMTMKHIDRYPLVDGDNRFEKGSYHLMVMDLKTVPKLDATYEMTLTLDDGSKVSCDAVVKRPEDLMK